MYLRDHLRSNTVCRGFPLPCADGDCRAILPDRPGSSVLSPPSGVEAQLAAGSMWGLARIGLTFLCVFCVPRGFAPNLYKNNGQSVSFWASGVFSIPADFARYASMDTFLGFAAELRVSCLRRMFGVLITFAFDSMLPKDRLPCHLNPPPFLDLNDDVAAHARSILESSGDLIDHG